MYPAYHADTRAKEMIPSHMPPSSPYLPWPYAPNFSYPIPHGCCNNACYGGGPYGFQPHYPPPQHFHPHGLYPPFPGAYPAYHVPPPHYSIDQPRYDYDKNNHHCCGYKDVKTPTIKEEPQVDKKTSDSDSSLVPLLLKDRPEYPIMWVPRGYITNTESEAKEKDKDNEKHSHDTVLVKHLEPSKQGGHGEMAGDHEYPILWVPRGYMTDTGSEANEKEKHSQNPVSVKHLEPSKRDGNGEMVQDEKGGDGNRFPFKIFWLPSKNNEAGNDTKADTHDLVARTLAEDTIKNKENPGTRGECETNKKHVVQKVIPVKQASTKEETKNPKSIETNMNTGSVEKTDNGSSGSPKASKLPPVCLRVDPLRRKKKSSRSPSPAAEKQRSNGSPVNTPKSSQQEAQVFKKSKEEQGEVKIKTVEQDNFTNNVANGKRDESENGKVEEEEKKKFSEDVAALIIQSVYRGFEVRKSQPLKKLRQIYEVKKQVLELRNRIQELETSSFTNQIDGKKEVIIGESIMSLLLKLDTIQGLHPFVREVRKSVAKELVGLQERLDSLVKSKTPSVRQITHPEDAKSDQAQEQTSLNENREQKFTESQCDGVAEACNTTDLEQQLGRSTDDDAKFDRAPMESDSVTCENQEVESGINGEPQVESHREGSDQAPIECNEDLGLCENNEVEATEESKEGCNTNGEPQLESDGAELNQPPTETECVEACDTIGEPQVESERDEAVVGLFEARESEEVCNTNGELQLESSHKVKLNQAPTDCDEVESHKEKPAECDEALGFCVKQEVEAIESQEGDNSIGELQQELYKEKLDQTAAAECENTDNGGAVAHDTKHEISGDADKLQMDDMETESSAKENEGENEKLRMAMEELLNEQLSVIRELTGRVKDLEKKLSKKQNKKKIKVNKGKRSRDCVVEPRDCLVSLV